MLTENTSKLPIDTIVIKDFVYVFKTFTNKDLNLTSKSKIFLVINKKETSLRIEDLFHEEPEIDSSDIEGYSVLQMLINNQLKIDENISLEITFIDKNTNTEFFIYKIRRPLVYSKDLVLSAENRIVFVNMLLNAVVEDPRPSIPIIPVKSAEELQAEAVKAQAEADLQAKRNTLGGEHWKGIRNTLIENGHLEYIDGNYRLYFKPATEKETVIISFYHLIPGDYIDIQLYEDDISPEMEIYSFEDSNNTEWAVKFNPLEGSLKVQQFSEV